MKIGKYSESYSDSPGRCLEYPMPLLCLVRLSESSHFATLLGAGSTSITLALSSSLFPLAFVAFTFECD
jgi:hypothetical protein